MGTQIAHGAVRAYAMGERGARNEPANVDDIKAMAKLVQDAIEAGALGFSSSRTLAHRAMDGEPVPGTFAAEDELFALGRATAAGGAAVSKNADAFAAELRPMIDRLREEGCTSLWSLARALNLRRIATPRQREWHASSVRNLLIRLRKLESDGGQNGREYPLRKVGAVPRKLPRSAPTPRGAEEQRLR